MEGQSHFPAKELFFTKPCGSSLVETRNRMLNEDFARLGNYPQVPADTNTFVNRGLNA